MRYFTSFFFPTKYLKSCVHFTLMAHLSLDKSHFKGSKPRVVSDDALDSLATKSFSIT